MRPMQTWSSERLHTLRAATGLSVRQFAETVGVSDKTVYRWEGCDRDDIRIESGPHRILTLLEAEVEKAQRQDQLEEFGRILIIAAATGGGLYALYRLLQRVFPDRGSG